MPKAAKRCQRVLKVLTWSGAFNYWRKGESHPDAKTSVIWWAKHTEGKIQQGLLIRNHPKFAGLDVDVSNPRHVSLPAETNKTLNAGGYKILQFWPTLRKFSERQAINLLNEALKEPS